MSKDLRFEIGQIVFLKLAKAKILDKEGKDIILKEETLPLFCLYILDTKQTAHPTCRNYENRDQLRMNYTPRALLSFVPELDHLFYFNGIPSDVSC